MTGGMVGAGAGGGGSVTGVAGLTSISFPGCGAGASGGGVGGTFGNGPGSGVGRSGSRRGRGVPSRPSRLERLWISASRARISVICFSRRPRSRDISFAEFSATRIEGARRAAAMEMGVSFMAAIVESGEGGLEWLEFPKTKLPGNPAIGKKNPFAVLHRKDNQIFKNDCTISGNSVKSRPWKGYSLVQLPS